MSQMLGPIETSRIFDSVHCRRHIEQANLSAWQQLLGPQQFRTPNLNAFFWPWPLQSIETCCCPGRMGIDCLHYIHNPKAGSSYLGSSEGLPSIVAADAHHSCWQCHTVPNIPSARVNHSTNWPSRHEIVFTAVRDPIARALAAYNELQRRPVLSEKMVPWGSFEHGRLTGAGGWPPSYLSLPCDNRTQRTLRFEAYLDALIHGWPVGREAHHTWPQALSVDYVTRTTAPRFDAILRLEDLQMGTEVLAALANLSLNSQFTLRDASDKSRHSTQPGSTASPSGSATNHTTVTHQTHQMTQSQHRTTRTRSDFLWKSDPHFTGCADVDLEFADGRLLRKLCRLYAVDFACFRYAQPAACRSMR